MSSDRVAWILSEETQKVKQEIIEVIKDNEKILADGSLLISQELEREYCSVVGEIRGLKLLIEKLTIEENTDESA